MTSTGGGPTSRPNIVLVPKVLALMIVLALVALSGCSQGGVSGAGNSPQLGDVALSSGTKGLTVLVVGDSLARALGEGMSAVSEGQHVRIVNAAIGGCGLLLPVEQRVEGELKPTDPQCNAWPDKWPALVKKYDPDAIYLTTSFWDTAQQMIEPNGKEGTLADPEFQDRWLTNATRAIKILSADGATVYFDDLNEPGLHGVQGRAVRESTSAHLLPLYAQMCADAGCPPRIGGIQVLDDTGHPAGESRDRLARWILNSISKDHSS